MINITNRNKTLLNRIRFMYSQMKKRSKTKQLSLLSKEEFLHLALSSTTLLQLYNNWFNSGFKLSLTPTPDRINNLLGYDIDNIQFLSYVDNQSKGSIETKTGKAKKGKQIVLTHNKTKEVLLFLSGTQARLFLGLPKTKFYTYVKSNSSYNDYKISYSIEV